MEAAGAWSCCRKSQLVSHLTKLSEQLPKIIGVCKLPRGFNLVAIHTDLKRGEALKAFVLGSGEILITQAFLAILPHCSTSVGASLRRAFRALHGLLRPRTHGTHVNTF